MKNYTNEDLEHLTKLFGEYWEFDLGPKVIRRKRNKLKLIKQWIFWNHYTFPVQILYRFVKDSWLQDSKIRGGAPYPFASMPVKGVFCLDNGWSISIRDRKYLNNGPLYASNGTTIIVPQNRNWWENGTIQLISLVASVISIIGIFVK